MSSSIWTRCGAASEIRALGAEPWRVVEAQHQISTRKLVATREEQELLEELIERVKPPALAGRRRHYLIATPFRYPPLGHGSRFGTRLERGIWYGSESRRTTFAELAYYRLVFLEGTHADLPRLVADHTLFNTAVGSRRGMDLTRRAFATCRAAIASPTSYGETQALGAAMREAGVDVIRYPSARDAQGGVNIAVLAPSAFTSGKPRGLETWRSTATRERVEVVARSYFAPEVFTFERGEFLVDGALPAPAS